MSSAVASLVIGAGSICTRSRGAPMRSNCACTNSSSRAQVDAPFGEGATMTALRALSALMILLAGVAAGLVEGVTRATTPTGRAISTRPRSGSSAMTPTVRTPCEVAQQPERLAVVLADLVLDVADARCRRTASSASSRLRPGSRIAQPAAATSSSTRAWS